MFRPLVAYIGLRYTRAKRRTRFISFITFTSVFGIALGVTVMITVLSVMNGFTAELRERILGMTAHATVTGSEGALRDWALLEPLLSSQTAVQSWAPYTEGQVMLTAGHRVSGAMLRGVLPALEPRVSAVGDHFKQGALGDLKGGAFSVVLGKELAQTLGVGVGDQITVITPELNATPAGILPRLKRFTVVGLFEIGMYEYDRNMALIHLDDAGKLFRMQGAVSGLRLKLDDLFNAPRITFELNQVLGRLYQVSDWTRMHSNFFAAVQMEKRMMFIILLLIVAVAAFNIVSTLVMLVTDKRADIAILRTMGLTPMEVMGIFMVLGSVIGLFGTLLGMVGGVALALNIKTLVPLIERTFGIDVMPGDVYYLSELPSKLMWSDVYQIAAAAFVLSLLATIYPAWQASRIRPAEELRYE